MGQKTLRALYMSKELVAVSQAWLIRAFVDLYRQILIALAFHLPSDINLASLDYSLLFHSYFAWSICSGGRDSCKHATPGYVFTKFPGPGMFLCVVGGATSNQMPKSSGRMGEAEGCLHWEKGARGELIATDECQSSVLLSLSRLRLRLWVGNICLTAFSLLPEKEEMVKQWLHWIGGVSVRLINVKREEKDVFYFLLLCHLSRAFLQDWLISWIKKNTILLPITRCFTVVLLHGTPICRLTENDFSNMHFAERPTEKKKI